MGVSDTDVSLNVGPLLAPLIHLFVFGGGLAVGSPTHPGPIPKNKKNKLGARGTFSHVAVAWR